MEPESSQKNLQEQEIVPVKTTRLADKEKMKSIPKEQRQLYIQRMLKVPQLPGPPPYSFKKSYPTQGKFKYKQFDLHYYANQSSLKPKAILISCHGMGAHSQLGGYFANTIFEEIGDVNVYAFDQMNFGKSQGPYRGLLSSLEENAQQAETFLDFIMKRLQGQPKVFLIGISYGGAISFRMSLRVSQRYAGIIFLAPALRFLSAAYGFMPYLAKLLACCCPVFRMHKIKQYPESSRYNRDQELLSDELVYNDGNIPHSYDTIMKALDGISTEYHLLKSPYICFQGGTDKSTDPFAPLDLEEQSPSPDKTTLYSEEMWHLVYGEMEIQEITQVSIKWLRERI